MSGCAINCAIGKERGRGDRCRGRNGTVRCLVAGVVRGQVVCARVEREQSTLETKNGEWRVERIQEPLQCLYADKRSYSPQSIHEAETECSLTPTGQCCGDSALHFPLALPKRR